jgi:hypothetical protein
MKIKLKDFISKVVDYCAENGESLSTRNVIDVAVRDFDTSAFDNHEIYYSSRWYISELRRPYQKKD